MFQNLQLPGKYKKIEPYYYPEGLRSINWIVDCELIIHLIDNGFGVDKKMIFLIDECLKNFKL